MTLKQRLTADMKAAMKAKQQDTLAAIRLIMAAIKQREVDERTEMTEADIVQILDKMSKQRKESIAQYSQAGRQELVAQEQFELDLIRTYLPQPLAEQEVEKIINAAIANTGAASIKDMSKVMAAVKNQLQGKADMAVVSTRIKSLLTATS